MNINSRLRFSFYAVAALLILAGSPPAARGQTVQIAPMTLTPRSDWINVQTDAALTVRAAGDGHTDDTAAIQQALTLASAKTATRVTVYFPPGTYLVSQTLSWASGTAGSIGRSLVGCGSRTTLSWTGTVGGTMFRSLGEASARYVGLQWQGNGIAATAVDHWATTRCEVPLRHFNEAFLNFTGVALNFDGDGKGAWSGQAEIVNCLFYKCHYGSQIGLTTGNIYEYQFERCEFQQCDTGIDSCGNTAQMIYDTHFTGSVITDIYARLNVHVRHCASNGSKAFFTSVPWSGASANLHVFQDCWVDSWTAAGSGTGGGALRIGDRCQAMVFDCRFTNPPDGNPPINLINPYGLRGGTNLLVNNNSCPGFASQSGMVSQTNGNSSINHIVPLDVAPANPNVGITTVLNAASHVFLDSSPIVESAPILDVTQYPYSAAKDGSADARSAIQSAINDARAAANGTVVYLPAGYYNLASALDLSGSNYTVAGSLACTQICWSGSDGGTMLNAAAPSNVALRDLVLKTDATIAPNTAGITVTGSSTLSVDGVAFWNYLYPRYGLFLHAYYGRGVLLSGLPKGSRVVIEKLEAPLTVHDCGPAEIFIDHLAGGQLNVDGSSAPKTGFLGINYANVGVFNDPASYDVIVNDNQDLVIADFYNEQTNNNLKLSRGGASWTGRVTLQGFKQQSWNTSAAITVDNYNGWLFYGPQSFANSNGTNASGTETMGVSVPTVIRQTGTSPFILMLPMDRFWEVDVPSITTGSSCRLIQLYNTITTIDGTQVDSPLPNVPVSLTSADMVALAAGLDHLRQLGLEDLKLMCGLLSLTGQPQTAKVAVGQTAAFSVEASGASALSYQWFKNGEPVTCATSASYTTPPVAVSDSGAVFQAVVSGSDQRLVSGSATLLVLSFITVTAQPQSVAVALGQTARFTVGAHGDSAIAYQWLKNGEPIAGATLPGYTTPPAAVADNGSAFSVTMTCAEGTVTSATAVLTVGVAPIFEADFNGAGTGAGGTANLVTLGGSATLGTASEMTNTIRASPSMGQDNYLKFALAAASNTKAFNVLNFTPASAAHSFAAWTGTVTSGTSAYTAFNGAFDMFVRPNIVLSGSQSWCRPVDINNRSGNSGLRMILTGGGSGFQFQLISNNAAAFSADGVTWNSGTKTLNIPYVMTTGSVNHVALVMRTGAAGLVTVNVYGEPGSGAIVTGGTGSLRASMQFYASAAAIGSSVLYSGSWSLSARTIENWAATEADYDVIRLYDTDPGILPAISAPVQTSLGSPPSITASPGDATVLAGRAAVFSVLAAGAPAPVYQWLRGGVPIAGATAASYTTPLAETGDSGAAYSVLAANASGTAVSGTALLTVLCTYDAWKGGRFTSAQLADPAVSGPEASPAGDGVSNLLKYALGLDPGVCGRARLPVAAVGNVDGDSYLQISYRQRYGAGDLAYEVQVSDDLVRWNSGDGFTTPVSRTDNGDGTQTVTIRSVEPMADHPRLFIRLLVTQE